MKIPSFSLRTTSLFILISLAHIASLLNLNFYAPKTESKIANTDQLQTQITNEVAIELNLNISESSILPSVKQDSKTAREVSLAEFRPESDENSRVFSDSKKIIKRSVETNKNLKDPHLEVALL